MTPPLSTLSKMNEDEYEPASPSISFLALYTASKVLIR